MKSIESVGSNAVAIHLVGSAASDQVRAAALSTLNSSIAIATFKAALGPNDASIGVKVLSLRDSSTNTHEGESMISGGLVYVISAAGMLLSLAATTVLLRRRDSKLKHDLQTIMSRYSRQASTFAHAFQMLNSPDDAIQRLCHTQLRAIILLRFHVDAAALDAGGDFMLQRFVNGTLQEQPIASLKTQNADISSV
ncbi:hypothetical protein DYB31_014477 [Aphanomyces astaci]|uniref:Uncharacterized protein n=1 Tax=Aphanomyces astaci TaxID=112090 RepID=A0A397EUT0_APHAT|nr:hypothetical protein DYB31_014477 [Aphanomyces astaci]